MKISNMLIKKMEKIVRKETFTQFKDSFTEKEMEIRIRRDMILNLISRMPVNDIDKVFNITKEDLGDRYLYKLQI